MEIVNIEARTFDMQAKNRRILLFHQVFTDINCLVDSFMIILFFSI